VIVVFSVLIALGATTARSATITWINTGGGNWSGATNWSANQVPGATDTAVITAAGNYTVSLDVSATVAGLVLGASGGGTTQTLSTSGSTLSVNGPIEVSAQGQFKLNGGALAGTSVLTGTLAWSGGNMSGVLTLASNSVLNIVAGGGYGFNGLVLTNYGTVNWTNTTIYGINNNNVQIYNYGLWNAQSDNSFEGGYGGGTSLFENFGTFLKSGSTNATVFDVRVVFNNTGTVQVASGTLDLNGGGTNSGASFITSNSAVINFSGFLFTNNNTFTGPGNFVAGGAAFGGTIQGTLSWDAGSLAGVMTLATNGVLNIVAGGGDGFNGLVLTNYGTVNWTNTTIYGVNNNNAQIYNYGLWNAQSDNSFEGGYGGGTTLFENFGTFLKSGTTNATVLDSRVVFNNIGTVNVESGTMEIGGGTSSGGGFVTASSATLVFIDTPYNFANTTTLSGLGGSVAAGANFNGTIAGTLGWNGGNLDGVLTIATNSVFNIVAGGGDGFNGLVLTNYGTVNWTNTAIYGLNNNNAQIYNYGLWNAQSDNSFEGGYGGGTTLFENFGTFLKSGATGATVLDGRVVFNNTGTVSVASGTLDLEGGGTNSGGGTFTMANTGQLGLDNMIFANSATIHGSNVVQMGGDTTVSGVLTVANLDLVDGELRGTNLLTGTLTWSGGSMSGVLTLASNSVLNIVAGGGDGFNGLVLTNYGTVNWTNTTIYGINNNNAQIYNYGLWNAQSDNTFEGGYGGGTTLFENFGTFLKSGATNATVFDGRSVFNNTGTVEVASGTLNLNGGGASSGGSFATSNSAVINFSGFLFTNNNTFAGPGSFVAGGAATFGGTIVGTLNWDGGSLAGAMTLTSNSVLNIVAGGGDGFNGLVLTNYGTVNWTNTTLYGINNNNAQIYNYGLWNAQGDNTFEGGYGGGTTLFENFGTFLKSTTTGATVLDGRFVFNNTGTVDVESGTLNLEGGGENSGGSFATTNNAVINFSGFLFTNNNTFAGPGNFVAGGATFGGTIAGTLTWDGGSLAGVMTLASNSVLNIVAGGGDALDGLVLTNYGTVNWTGTTIYGINNNNAQIYNYGLWYAQSDNAFEGGYSGGTTLFENFGTFLKSGTTGTTTLDGRVEFDNAGTVDVESGTVSLNGDVNLAGGTLDFAINNATNYSTVSLAGGTVLGGTINANFENGFFPALGSQFALVSCANPSGAFTSAAPLPVGMSFVYSKTGATLVWNGLTQADWAAGSSCLHGAFTTTFWNSPGTSVQIVATVNGSSYVLATSPAGGLGTVSYNSSQLSNGVYNLKAIVLNAAGQVVGDYSRNVFVNDSLAWHEGMLSSSQTWGTNAVNAVDQNVIIPSGVTLTLAPGAIVKFTKGAGIIVEAGGILDASGATTNAPIILTSISDDSVGGDSNEDGDGSIPEAGDWNGVTASGQFLENSFVDLRYVLQTYSGTISQSQEWSGSQEHLITGNIIVPTNVTLTIDPGAIIKFNPGLNLTVQAGGKLIAAGTYAQPIVFTSVNDQSVGAITSAASTNPAAGDWDSIYLDGGRATFDHVSISYGGGPDSLNSGLISIIGSGSILTISDSILNQGFYRGIQAEYGTANISNCVVIGCDRGIQSGLSGPTVVNVINCTLEENNYGLFAHGGVLNVANTLIADSLTAGVAYCCGSSLTTFEYNDIWSATGSYSAPIWPIANQTGINGNISANPKFVNAAQGNYQLDYGSPCIDAANGLVAPPTDLTGAPRYNDPQTVVKTGVTNANGLYPDIGAFEFVKTASSPVDLIVNSVVGPLQLTGGETVTVQWNDVNAGTGNAIGPWHDTISLAPQNGGAPLAVATVLVAQNVTLGAGQTYAASASVVVPGGLQGLYQLQVQVNSEGDVFEGVNWTNNTTLATALSSLSDPMLTIGGATLTNAFTSAGQSAVFAVASPGSNFVLNVQGNTPGCALKLFVGDGYVPTPSQFDFQSSQFDSPTASLTVPSNNRDTYFVVVYAASLGASIVDYTLTAGTVGFALSSVNPASMANSGSVTLQIQGNQLASSDTYTLAGSGGSFGSSSAQAPDPTVAYATFNLGGAAAGVYSLQVAQPGGATLTLSNAVVVTNVTAAAPSFSIQLVTPPAFRTSRPFGGTIVYSDTGAVDMPAPILILTSGGVAGMALQGSTNYQTSDQLLVAASFQGPAGTLTPGQSWSIAFTALCTAQTSIPFAVNYQTADATNLIDYSSLESGLRPPGYSDTDWQQIWTNFQAAVGPTWGGFVSFVDAYATQMALDNPTNAFYNVPDVLAYAFADELAQAQTSVTGTLFLGDTDHPLAETYLYLSGTNDLTGAAESSADGTFRFLNLTNGVYSATVPHYWLPTPVQITMPDSGIVSNVNIIVSQGATIQGVIYDQFGGLFLTNVFVEAVSTTTSNVFTGSSGTDGSYALNGLPPDTYYLSVGNGSYPVQETGAQPLSDGQIWTTNFFLSAGATVTGQVSGAGQPLAGAFVSVTDADSNLTSVATDTNGLFSVDGLDAGLCAVEVEAPGYAPFTMQTNLLAGRTLNLGTISLSPGATIVGVLDNTNLQALPLAPLALWQNGILISEQYADTNGVAVFNDLAPGTYVLTGSDAGYPDLSNTITVASGATVTNTTYLGPLASIAGQVTDATDTPLSGLAVNVFGLGSSNQNIAFTVQTDSNGNYTLPGLTAGLYLVTVGNEGGIDGEQVTIDESLGTKTVNLVLNSSVVSGVVLDSDGVTPLVEATVWLSQGSQVVASAKTGTNGLYHFRVVAPGTYTLAAGAAAEGMTSNQTVVVTSGANLTAAALEIGSIQLAGTVTDTNSSDLANATLLLFPTGASSVSPGLSGTTTTNGYFALDGLVPGTYVVEIRHSGFATAFQTLSLTGSTNQSFELGAGATMAGTITDGITGLGVSNATVSILDPGTDFPVDIVQTDSQGNYSAPDLAASRYDVLINQGSYQIAFLTNVLVSANPFALNAALSATNTVLKGVVTDAASNPMGEVIVTIADPNTGQTLLSAQTAIDGSWSTTQLPAGAYSVSVSVIGYFLPAAVKVSLAPGVPQSVATVLTAAATDDIPGFFEGVSQQLGITILNAFSSVNPPEPLQTYPLPVVACPCAIDAYLEVLHASGQLGVLYDTWVTAYNNGATSFGAQSAITGVEATRMAADFASLAVPGGSIVGGLSALSTADKAALAAVPIADATKASLAFLMENLPTMESVNLSDPKSVKAGIAAVVATIDETIANGNAVAEIAEAAEHLRSLNGIKYNPASPLVRSLDAILVAVDLYKTYQEYQEAAEASEKAANDYEEAYQEYLKARKAYGKANSDCDNCPPKKEITPPPTPPDPTPGPNDDLPDDESEDPNNKSTTGLGLSGWVMNGETITYTIGFQNETNASAPAQTVTVTDSLDTNLNWSTLQLTAIGFNNVTIEIPSGVQSFSTNVSVSTDPNPVAVSASLDPATGVVTWSMESINPVTGELVTDPLAGFLPPDNAQGQGEGYVAYTVVPRSGLTNGTVITNQAVIVFDLNNPIPTDITTNEISAAATPSGVSAVATSTNGSVMALSWSRAGLGANLAAYDIYVSTNGGSWSQWLTNTTNTSALFQGIPGNSYGFYSIGYNVAGFQEAAKTNADVTMGTLTVTVNGGGTLQPNLNGTAFEQVGSNYTMTAIPAFSYEFTGWTGGITNGASNLSFTMTTGLALQANFARIPYSPTNGTYYGLFYPSSSISFADSGAITLTTAAKSKFTAKLQLAGATYSLSGLLDTNGGWAGSITPKGASPIGVQLLISGTDDLSGTVSNADWLAYITAERAVYDGKKTVAPQQGQYTLVIAGTNGAADMPAGYGCATLTVSAAGKVTLSGSLADGTKISQSSIVSGTAQWPLFISLYSTKGSVLSWMAFTNAQTLGGDLFWSKPALSAKVYPAAFSWQTPAYGARYYPPGKGENVFGLTSSSLELMLEGGNLGQAITEEFTLNASDQATGANGKKMNLTFTPSTGLFKGGVTNTIAPHESITFNGVVLQNQTTGCGFFLGTNQSGAVFIAP
jgi:hypothetical protein